MFDGSWKVIDVGCRVTDGGWRGMEGVSRVPCSCWRNGGYLWGPMRTFGGDPQGPVGLTGSWGPLRTY